MSISASLRRRAAAALRRILPFRTWVAAHSVVRRLSRPDGPALATPADLRASYRLLLGRVPDRRGELDFLSLIELGITRDELVRHFVSSPEFRQRRLADDRRSEEDPTTVVIDDLVFHPHPANARTA